jgi:hypothetical protein
MRYALTIMVVLLVLSCSTDQEMPTTQAPPAVNGNSQTAPARMLSTTCRICSNSFQALPTGYSSTGILVSDTRTSSQYEIYPAQTVQVPANTTSIGFTLYAADVPNNFTLTFLNASGGTVTSFNSGWMGYASYPGPWGMGGISVNNTMTPSPVNTGAQTTQWPCPYILPGTTTATLEYENDNGTPWSVTWSITANSPSNSISLPSNGNVNQPFNLTSLFSSASIQATTNDPPHDTYQNCNTDIDINIPTLSGIASVRVEVVGLNAPGGSQDYWHVNFGWTRNTTAGNCPRCY